MNKVLESPAAFVYTALHKKISWSDVLQAKQLNKLFVHTRHIDAFSFLQYRHGDIICLCLPRPLQITVKN